MRTSDDFVDEMVENGRDWVAIISVGRAIRQGRWYEEIKKRLQDDGMMPKDPSVAHKLQNEAIAKAQKEQVGRELAERIARRRK